MKWMEQMYEKECSLFYSLNSHFDRKRLNVFFRFITHLGGAWMTVGVSAIVILFATMPVKLWGIQSAAALAGSHLLVAAVKKIYPRSRPYMALSEAKVLPNPLRDHSFPSGHTTAIFSLITPYVIHVPVLGIFLIPIAFSVALSRIFLGLHYPSDVLAGALLGTLFGIFAVFFI